MNRFPKDEIVVDYFDRLSRHARPLKPGDRDRLPTLTELQRRLLVALKRARTPGPDVDGYPSNLGGEGVSGAKAELTSVEAAAQARIGVYVNDDGTTSHREQERAQIDEQTEQAVGYLVDAVQALGALSSVLDRIDRLKSVLPRAEAGGAGSCLACGNDVSGAAEDRLKRGLGPCCYSSWVRQGRPDLAEFKRLREAS